MTPSSRLVLGIFLLIVIVPSAIAADSQSREREVSRGDSEVRTSNNQFAPSQDASVGSVPVLLAALPAPSNVQGATASAQLASQMNSLCWALHRNYQSRADFDEAYRETYELLEISQKIDAQVQAGKIGDELKELLDEFAGEIHHVQHHIVEFTAQDKVPTNAGVWLEEVEATLGGLLKEYNVAHQKAGHDHGDEGNADPKELASELSVKMNQFCWAMIKNHKGKADFDEAYRESYELLEIAKVIDKSLAGGNISQETKESLSDFDSEIHHVEHHVAVFAGGGKVEIGGTEDPALEKLESVEGILHRLMLAAGVKTAHAKQHEHDHDNKPEEHNATKSEVLEQATELVQKTILFCNSMSHNYKNNHDYKEAYKEAVELYEISKQVADGIKAGGVTDAVKENLSEMDSEIHHVEKHVLEFVADDDGSKDGPRRLGRKLKEVEKAMHTLMQSAGVKRKHLEKDHDHADEKKSK